MEKASDVRSLQNRPLRLAEDLAIFADRRLPEEVRALALDP